MKQKYGSMALALLLAACLLSGCSAQSTSASVSVSTAASSDTAQQDAAQATTDSTEASVIDTTSLFSDRDLDGSYDTAAAVAIQLQGDDVVCDSDAVTVQDGTITISQEGVYLVTGTLTDGQIQVNAPDDAKVQIVLSGASVTSSSASIYALNADKVFLPLAEETENTLANGGEYIPYCYEGIEGLSITVEDGDFQITSVDDGMNAAGGADSSGFGGFGRGGQDSFRSDSGIEIVINGGSFVIVSEGDCIDSNGALTINGGTLELTCNGSGNTALDADGGYTNNGGSVTTNDGSETTGGGMTGGPGGGDQAGGRKGGAVPNGEAPARPGDSV